jgi:hypothetical protein
MFAAIEAFRSWSEALLYLPNLPYFLYIPLLTPP